MVDNTTNQVRYKGLYEHGLYTLPLKPSSVVCQAIYASTWHCRLSHRAPTIAKSILSSLSYQFSTPLHCELCFVSKSYCLPFELSEHKAMASFHLIHSDVWSPTSITSLSGFHYYISFIDDFSKYSHRFIL